MTAGFVLISAITVALVVAGVYLADAIVGLAVGRLLLGRARGTAVPATEANAPAGRDRWADLGPLVVGVAIVAVLTSLPALGALVKLVVVLVGLGALWLALRSTRVAVVPAAPPPDVFRPPSA